MWIPGTRYLRHQQQWLRWYQEPFSHFHAVVAVSNEFELDQTMPPDTGLHLIIPLTNYNMLKKLLAVTAYINRFIQTLHNKVKVSKGPLTAVELDKARNQQIQLCQQEVYLKESIYTIL